MALHLFLISKFNAPKQEGNTSVLFSPKTQSATQEEKLSVERQGSYWVKITSQSRLICFQCASWWNFSGSDAFIKGDASGLGSTFCT